MKSEMISIIIPTFKPKDYLNECLKNIKKQDYLGDVEILIILNGPKDPYWDKCQELVLLYENVFLYYSINSGVSAARNLGLEKAKGKYIVFIDDDDYVNSTYLSDLSKLKSNNSIVISRVIQFSEFSLSENSDYLSKPFRHKKEKLSLLKSKEAMSSSCAKLIPINVIKDVRFTNNLEIGEDALFMFKISSNIKFVVLANNAIYYRRRRESSASMKKRSLKYIFVNRIFLIVEYTKTYVYNIRKIQFLFYLNRIAAVLKSIVNLI